MATQKIDIENRVSPKLDISDLVRVKATGRLGRVSGRSPVETVADIRVDFGDGTSAVYCRDETVLLATNEEMKNIQPAPDPPDNPKSYPEGEEGVEGQPGFEVGDWVMGGLDHAYISPGRIERFCRNGEVQVMHSPGEKGEWRGWHKPEQLTKIEAQAVGAGPDLKAEGPINVTKFPGVDSDEQIFWEIMAEAAVSGFVGSWVKKSQEGNINLVDVPTMAALAVTDFTAAMVSHRRKTFNKPQD